eukprot:COSAG06_NODE_629_length_13646_cov_13.351222_13_plen_57_part_00
MSLQRPPTPTIQRSIIDSVSLRTSQGRDSIALNVGLARAPGGSQCELAASLIHPVG